MKRPANVPKDIIDKGETVRLMKERRDAGGFTHIGDAIDLQIAEREHRILKLETFKLVE